MDDVGPSGDVGPSSERDPSSDRRALVARIRQGDESALAELYDLYAPRMLGLLGRATGDTRVAETLLMTVFLEIWRRPFDALVPEPAGDEGWILAAIRRYAPIQSLPAA